MRTCPHCGHTLTPARVSTSSKRPHLYPAERVAAMSESDMRAYYRQRSHVDDARFFMARMTAANHPTFVREARFLMEESESGAMSRAATLTALQVIQDAWRRQTSPGPTGTLTDLFRQTLELARLEWAYAGHERSRFGHVYAGGVELELPELQSLDRWRAKSSTVRGNWPMMTTAFSNRARMAYDAGERAVPQDDGTFKLIAR